MTGPQLLAHLAQIHVWFKEYGVNIKELRKATYFISKSLLLNKLSYKIQNHIRKNTYLE